MQKSTKRKDPDKETMIEERWFPPEDDLNEFGQMIWQARLEAKLSRQEVCEGLCSERFLSLLEAGERGCERILAEALLGRMGISLSRFLYFLGPQEEKSLLAQEHLIKVIRQEEWEKLEDCKREYEDCMEQTDRQHHQILLVAEVVAEWKQSLKELVPEKQISWKQQTWLKRLQLSWSLTRGKYLLSGKQPSRMNLRELFIKSFYFRIREEVGEWKEALAGYQDLLSYLTEHTRQQVQMRVYSQIAYRVLCLFRDKPTDEEERENARNLWRTSMMLLKKQGGLYHLPELLEYAVEGIQEEYEGEPPSKLKRKAAEMKEFALLIRWLCEVYQEQIPEWDWYFSYEMEEVYRFQDVIRGRRAGYDLDLPETAEGICEKREIQRLEAGEVTPKKVILIRLMRKLKFPGGNGTLAVQIGDPKLWQISGAVSDKTMFAEYGDDVKEGVETLKKEEGRNLYVDQHLKELEATTLYSRKEISAEENQQRLWEALHMTMPKKEPEELREWVFMKREAAILNVLAHSYDKLGKQEEGIKWLYLLKDYYERQVFSIEHYRDNYELTLRNLGNMLGNIGRYQEAIEVEKIAIALALRSGRGNILRITLYDMGWNMEQLWADGIYTKEESCRYIRAALAFAKFYEKEDIIKQIKEHLKRVYGEVIEDE